MSLRRVVASVAVTALLLGSVSLPALAERGGQGNSKGSRISQQFEDMGDFQWGLQDVTKLMSKGVFKGRGDHVFAPGAKISHQETAVAIVRLMGKETEALALSAAEINTLLGSIPDQAGVAVWARPAVAMLVKVGAINGTAPFTAAGDATRLDVAVLLVKALGYDAEAQAKMNAQLAFKDAHLIPVNLVGYVAAAVDHKLITGYEDRTFRPNQAVKRVEMAVMMGRADNQIDRRRQDEVKGVIKSVSAAANSFVVTTESATDVTLTLAEDASIFVDNLEKDLSALAAGMTVQVKLNGVGKAVFVEAKSVPVTPPPVITGQIAALIQPTTASLGLVTVGTAIYPVSTQAAIQVNGQNATFADLKVGDPVSLTLQGSVVTKVEVTRETTAVFGVIAAVTPVAGTTPAALSVSGTVYVIPAATVIKINTETAALADLRVGDEVKVTLAGSLVYAVEVTRPVRVVEGAMVAMTAAVPASGSTPALPAQITISTVVNGSSTLINYSLQASTQILVNGAAAQFADLHLGDAVKVTLWSNDLRKIEVTR